MSASEQAAAQAIVGMDAAEPAVTRVRLARDATPISGGSCLPRSWTAAARSHDRDGRRNRRDRARAKADRLCQGAALLVIGRCHHRVVGRESGYKEETRSYDKSSRDHELDEQGFAKSIGHSAGAARRLAFSPFPQTGQPDHFRVVTALLHMGSRHRLGQNGQAPYAPPYSTVKLGIAKKAKHCGRCVRLARARLFVRPFSPSSVSTTPSGGGKASAPGQSIPGDPDRTGRTSG